MLRVECRVDDKAMLRHMAIAGAPEDVQVVLPLSDMGDGLSADLDESTPRLFVMFPLVTTERLPFPAVVNSKRFKPREDRDGIVLDGDTERIAENKSLLEAAAGLMVELLTYWNQRRSGAALSGLSDMTPASARLGRPRMVLDYLRKLIIETRQLPILTTQKGHSGSASWVMDSLS